MKLLIKYLSGKLTVSGQYWISVRSECNQCFRLSHAASPKKKCDSLETQRFSMFSSNRNQRLWLEALGEFLLHHHYIFFPFLGLHPEGPWFRCSGHLVVANSLPHLYRHLQGSDSFGRNIFSAVLVATLLSRGHRVTLYCIQCGCNCWRKPASTASYLPVPVSIEKWTLQGKMKSSNIGYVSLCCTIYLAAYLFYI